MQESELISTAFRRLRGIAQYRLLLAICMQAIRSLQRLQSWSITSCNQQTNHYTNTVQVHPLTREGFFYFLKNTYNTQKIE
nr:MAG TPA: hypothetical protein [Caudoviricetes sp.]